MGLKREMQTTGGSLNRLLILDRASRGVSIDYELKLGQFKHRRKAQGERLSRGSE